MEKSEISKQSSWLYVFLSLFGFIGAVYLTVKFYSKAPLNCLIFEDCSRVINSSYGQIFNIPLSLLGAIFYLTIFLLAVYYMDTKNSKVLMVVFLLTGFGFLFSLYLLYVQAFLLTQFCLYCLISAAIVILMFANTVYNYQKLK